MYKAEPLYFKAMQLTYKGSAILYKKKSWEKNNNPKIIYSSPNSHVFSISLAPPRDISLYRLLFGA